MTDTQLIVGMPSGSLADPKRGGSLTHLLKQAGFPTQGYDRGGPTSFPLSSFLVGWDGRPQEFGSQLALAEIDIAIAGDDWIHERQLELKYEYGTDIEVRKVLSLERGEVRIVVINADREDRSCDDWLKSLFESKPLLTAVSEMPYLALDWFRKKAAKLGYRDSHGGYSVQKFKSPPRIDSGVVIYETWGKTEAKVKNGAVDFGLEITQSGNALRNYGLSIAEEIMRSEAGVWVNPRIKEDTGKYDLARMFLLNLYGAIFAENKVMLLFNCSKEKRPDVLSYLETHKLFAEEPTMSEGTNFVEFNIQLDTGNKALPLAKVRYELAKIGASSIETIPLESSIPGLDVLEF